MTSADHTWSMLTVKSREILRPLPPVFPVLQQQVCLTSHYGDYISISPSTSDSAVGIRIWTSRRANAAKCRLLWHFYWLHLGGIKIAIPPSVGHQSTGEWLIPLPIVQIPALPSSGGICRRMWSIWRAFIASSRRARADHVIACDWSPAVSLYGRN